MPTRKKTLLKKRTPVKKKHFHVRAKLLFGIDAKSEEEARRFLHDRLFDFEADLRYAMVERKGFHTKPSRSEQAWFDRHEPGFLPSFRVLSAEKKARA